MIFQLLGSGTSTGVPIPGCQCEVCRSTNPRNNRTRTSALIRVHENYNIVIDTSTDFRYQALRSNLNCVNAVLYTHAHADHILGMDDLRGFNFIQRSQIPCYGTPATLKEIKRCFSYIFNQDQDYEGGLLPQLALHEIHDYEPFNVDSIRIQPFHLLHGKANVTGYRIGKLAYATDCNHIPPKSMELLKDLDVLFLDGLRFQGHSTHFTIPQAIKIAQELGVKKTYLLHTTHTVEYEEVSRSLPEGIELAYDGLEVVF